MKTEILILGIAAVSGVFLDALTSPAYSMEPPAPVRVPDVLGKFEVEDGSLHVMRITHNGQKWQVHKHSEDAHKLLLMRCPAPCFATLTDQGGYNYRVKIFKDREVNILSLDAIDGMPVFQIGE